MNPQLMAALIADLKDICKQFPTEELDACFTVLSKMCKDEKYCRKMCSNNPDKVVNALLRKATFAQLQDRCQIAMKTINEVKKARKTAS
jgi:hypothetical protein